jgi:hypothetical protein
MSSAKRAQDGVVIRLPLLAAVPCDTGFSRGTLRLSHQFQSVKMNGRLTAGRFGGGLNRLFDKAGARFDERRRRPIASGGTG